MLTLYIYIYVCVCVCVCIQTQLNSISNVIQSRTLSSKKKIIKKINFAFFKRFMQ